MWVVEARNLAKSYGERPILPGISFRLPPGNGLCLLGPSGCGKTTLLRIVAGLERPDGGSLYLDSETAGALKGGALAPEAHHVNLVFQDLALWPHMRTEGHLRFVLKGRGISRAHRKKKVSDLLELGQLTHRTRAYPAQLSGGEQQRLALLRALATEPRLLLLDEPFSSMGPAHIEPLKAEVRRRMDEGDLAVIIATHHPQDAEGLAGKTLVLG